MAIKCLKRCAGRTSRTLLLVLVVLVPACRLLRQLASVASALPRHSQQPLHQHSEALVPLRQPLLLHQRQVDLVVSAASVPPRHRRLRLQQRLHLEDSALRRHLPRHQADSASELPRQPQLPLQRPQRFHLVRLHQRQHLPLPLLHSALGPLLHLLLPRRRQLQPSADLVRRHLHRQQLQPRLHRLLLASAPRPRLLQLYRHPPQHLGSPSLD